MGLIERLGLMVTMLGAGLLCLAPVVWLIGLIAGY